MKKIFLFSVVALGAMLFTACNKSDKEDEPASQTGNLDVLLDGGKYVGMATNDVITDLQANGWTQYQPTSSEKKMPNASSTTYFTKKINSYKVNTLVHPVEGKCRTIDFESAGVSNYMQVAKSLYCKMGDSYYFTTMDVTAPFSSMDYADSEGEYYTAHLSYEEEKGLYSQSSVVEVYAYWWSTTQKDGFKPAVQICCGATEGEVEDNNGKDWIIISFGQL